MTKPQALYVTDEVGYGQYDSGCPLASRYMGKPSNCLSCPFPRCIYDRYKINLPIIERQGNNGHKTGGICRYCGGRVLLHDYEMKCINCGRVPSHY